MSINCVAISGLKWDIKREIGAKHEQQEMNKKEERKETSFES